MSVDADLVTRKLLLISADLERLAHTAGLGIDAYLRDVTSQAATERRLERAVGRMIDVNYHVITERGHPPPADYHASFLKLGEMGVLEPQFAARVARAAGLRNRLVHEYDELDHTKVFTALEDALTDVPVYLARLQSLLS